ncbi:hypothetical protein P9112_002465 [Eukaryota sp. TZLM1-RC]
MSWFLEWWCFSGKAAAAYVQAKRIIKLITGVANIVNNDPDVGDLLKVAFIPSYGVSLAEVIMPATDLSEQISTASTEASGTGNMKASLNGALVIGTMDGANIEIADKAGQENMFIFGLRTHEIANMRKRVCEGTAPALDSRLARVLNEVCSGRFGNDFQPLVDSIRGSNDHYLVCQDFAAYCEAQAQVDAKWHRKDDWVKSSILNTARAGFFSSDRSVTEYAEMWGLKPLACSLDSAPRKRAASVVSDLSETDDLQFN